MTEREANANPDSHGKCCRLSLVLFAAEDVAQEAEPGGGFVPSGTELLGEGADDGFAAVGGETLAVAGGLHDVEEALGEAFAVGGGGWGGCKFGERAGVFEALARELVEADGDGLS